MDGTEQNRLSVHSWGAFVNLCEPSAVVYEHRQVWEHLCVQDYEHKAITKPVLLLVYSGTLTLDSFNVKAATRTEFMSA